MNIAEGRLRPPLGLFDAHPQANRQATLSLWDMLAPDSVDRVCTSHTGCTDSGPGQKLLAEYVAEIKGGRL
jgi:hypothetical protein